MKKQNLTAALLMMGISFVARAQDAGQYKTAPAALKVVWSLSGFSTPESIVYDPDTDTYLVSNINGQPTGKDNNGFISEVSSDGKLLNPKFIAAGVNQVKLNAPKGMGLVNGILCVADIDVVRLFDRKTGAPQGEIKVPGATFLNDIAVSEQRVFISDSGLKAGKSGFEPTKSDALFEIDIVKKKAKLMVKDVGLMSPNGLCVKDGKLMMVPFGGSTLFAFSLDGKAAKETYPLPAKGLDGLIEVGGDLIFSSWDSKALYRGNVKSGWTKLPVELNAPADIVYDAKHKRVLVPRFMDNAIEAYGVE
jgi:hypothetical protein